ncbi:hypothetical protein SAMN04487996_105264 [Dyadobacter soli]|uniref:Uncharacterized protein n=1 Tax=Dyadobacter soli TaxID=659014 RepID=A0A1G7DM51_9BACT|nr:hypothetical protein [Dyadobacter soli]SDE51895.1 hypothetical protein SAMN04487996_105264 [Dyadobacter soli]
MEQLHPDPAQTEDTGKPGEESLSAYVQRVETGENLRKLAAKLKNELNSAVENEQPGIPEQEPDLSFSKFEEKRRARDGQ